MLWNSTSDVMSDINSRKLELGCGYQKPEGFWGVDKAQTDKVDQTIDLDKDSWPLPSNHFEVVRAMNIIEHLENPINFLEEIHRISKEGATVQIKGPHFTSADVAGDLTHKRGLSTTCLDDFTKSGQWDFIGECEFEILECKILFRPFRIQPHKHLGYILANANHTLYENTCISSILPAADVKWELKVVKY